MIIHETNATSSEMTVSERAVLYARVSGDDRKYATSGIEGQLNDCRRYAQAKNYQVVREFFEEPDKYTSGYDWLPELEKILRLARQRAFDVLIVREIDRLARNRFKQMSIENELELYGTRIEYVIGQFENSSEGRLLKGLMGEFAEYERNKISERMERGRMKATKKGKVLIGGSYAPYGYDLIDSTLIINEYESEVVKLIFDLYLNKDYTIYGIAEYLDNHHIPKAAKGNNHKVLTDKEKPRGWSDSTVGNILRNEAYTGRWYYNKSKTVKNPKTGKPKKVARPKSEWLMVEIPTIIDEHTFQAAQKRRQDNRRQNKSRKNQYLFGGMIDCGHCGKSVTGKMATYKDKTYGLYKCMAKHAPKKYGFKCEDSKTFRVEVVDNIVWSWIKSILLDRDYLDQVLNEYQNRQLEEQQPLIWMIEANQAKLAEVQQRKARLIEAYTSGVLSLDDIAPKKVELDKQIGELNEAINLLQADFNPRTLTKQEVDQIHEFAAKIRQGLDIAENSFKARRKIVELLRVQITLYVKEGKKWADVECILGDEKFAAENITTGRNGVARGHRVRARVSRQSKSEH